MTEYRSFVTLEKALYKKIQEGRELQQDYICIQFDLFEWEYLLRLLGSRLEGDTHG